ncbi:uncharacterized protein PGTG_18033 [Puccinia graminis f. sp. tritici CRL 75-36-700-3]|uniref:Uncharacterized protein n=1 Tax=Puccinia graminis f. sp. tritici (strain CRL 75-36-700-3 / race SCCL) TaxID=418459 RepID=E3L5L4_PUCGT|nr:uncharacterized protein PGTG_18033 [Puccinia graminis f. sp. tritici CRL 75-36-700-3]EFP91839.2 hypothetical protein PGTG_18033 [Puccinia graminis f. sp. tritici CRL 75-36-700-3]
MAPASPGATVVPHPFYNLTTPHRFTGSAKPEAKVCKPTGTCFQATNSRITVAVPAQLNPKPFQVNLIRYKSHFPPRTVPPSRERTLDPVKEHVQSEAANAANREPNLEKGKSFGMFNYLSSIVVMDRKSGETAIGVQFSGYGSRATSLVRDNVYFTVGRIVRTTTAGGYQCFFESNLSLLVGNARQYRKTDPIHPEIDLGSELLGKVWVFGFGTVIQTRKAPGVGINNTQQTDLHVTMRHHDYHNAKKSNLDFEAVYIVPGNAILRNTFGFFTVDTEALMIGNITGFNETLGTWEVLVYLFSTASGKSSFRAPPTPSGSGTSGQLRPGLRLIGGVGSSSPTAASNAPSQSDEFKTPSSSAAGRPFSPNVFPTPTPSTSRQSPGADEVSDGEITEDRRPEDAEDGHFLSTDKKGKRIATNGSGSTASGNSAPLSLADSQKRAKTFMSSM